MNGTIFNLQKFCVHDGDGIRTCVFLKGCPLRCIWCHNPEGLSSLPQLSFRSGTCVSCGRCLSSSCRARSMKEGLMQVNRDACRACGQCVQRCLSDACEILGREVTAEEVFEQVIEDRMFYESTGGGLTLSGGEPSMQADFSLALLTMARDAGIGRAVESCGIGSQSFYAAAADLGATFLYDLKCMSSEKHRALTGVDNAAILSNLQYLFSRNADVILRLPLIPSLNDTQQDLSALFGFLLQNAGKYRYAEIMPYHPLGIGKARQLGENEPFEQSAATREDIAGWKKFFEQKGVSVHISRE